MGYRCELDWETVTPAEVTSVLIYEMYALNNFGFIDRRIWNTYHEFE